jgi:N-acyl-D-aspartate/D-glutamate deacylase
LKPKETIMQPKFDRVIKNGTIIDGMRTPRYVSDIGIKNGRIAYIGHIADDGATEVIDAKGLVVAPGFVDLHTHYDSQIYWDPYCTISGWHGVTSVVIGNCGFGFAPCHPKDRDRAMLTMARNEAVPLATMQAGMPFDWESFPEFLDSIERTPKGVNVLSYVPLSPLLMYVMGLENAKSRSATAVERKRLRALFAEALDAGGCGFSAQYTDTKNVQRDYDGTPMITDVMAWDDLALFAEVLRERGEGFIQIATRPEVAERLAEISGRPVVWNALTSGMDQHGSPTVEHQEAIKWLNDANARGHRVFAQALTCGVSFNFTMEDWNLFDESPLWRHVTLGDAAERLRKMADPELRKGLRAEYDSGKGPIAGGGTELVTSPHRTGIGSLFVTRTSGEWAKYEGYTVADFAKSQGKHVIDAFLDLVVHDKLKTEFQTPPVKVEGKLQESMAEVVRSPVALPGVSDGGAHTKFITLGAYPTEFLIVHVRENKTIDLEEAHWRLSAYPAYAAGLKDRGVLREGMPADIVVYDFERLKMLPVETAHDFPANEWRRIRKAEGYRHILVNGVVTFVDGNCTGATPGHLLRHGYGSAVVTQADAA